MLQKLLIASFATLMLTACSGSDSSSSETVNEPPPAPSPDNPEPEPEPVGPTVLASINFGAETSVDSWEARCADGGSCGADITHSADEGVLVVNPAWVTTSDNLEVYTALDPEIADLAFANVEVDIRVTEEYLTDGNLRLQVFFENAAGGVAYTGWTTPETEYEGEDGEMVSTMGWTQLEFETLQMSSFSYTSDSFTLQNINAMGVQFVSNGKPVDVGGQLWIDNVRITAPSDADQPKTSISADLTEGWRVNGDGSLEYAEAGVVWTPTAAEEQLMWDLSGPQNLDGATYTFELVADAAFVAGGGTVQPIAQRTDDYSIGYYNCTIPASDFVAGETLVVECGPLPGDFDLTADMAVQIGLIAKDAAAGTVTVTDMTVDLADGVTVIEEPQETSIEANLMADWRLNNDADGTLEFTEAGVVWAPGAAEGQLMYDISGPQNLAGATYTFELIADADFVAGGGTVQPIAQRTDDYSIGYYNCTIPATDFVAGEALEVVCGPLPGTFELTADMAVQIGLIAKDNAAGTITVTNMTVDLADGVFVQQPGEEEPVTAIEAALDADWRLNNDDGGVLEYTSEGVEWSPNNLEGQLMWDLSGPQNLDGATYTFELVADADFVAGGGTVQPIAQRTDDYSIGYYNCTIPAGDFVAGEALEVECGPLPNDFDLTTDMAVQVGLIAKDAAAGTITVTEMTINLADGNTVQ